MTESQLDGRPLGRPLFGALAAALLVASAGCGTAGEMGNGTFYYECSPADDADAACTGWGSLHAIPGRIAVEASFRVIFEAHDSQLQAGIDERSIVVEPASWERAVGANGTFRLLESGTHSLIARSDQDGTTIDYTHVGGRDVTAVRLLSDVSADLDPLLLSVGQTAWLIAAPEDDQGAELAGRLDYRWASDDSSVASLEPGSYVDQHGVHGEAPGTTTVEVTVGGATRAVTVEVEP